MNATPTSQYNTVLSQAKKGVPGFALAYGKFHYCPTKINKG